MGSIDFPKLGTRSIPFSETSPSLASSFSSLPSPPSSTTSLAITILFLCQFLQPSFSSSAANFSN
ncbi:hypothetical protein LguiB_006761 [Lonicera macranthoides]